MRYLGLDLGTKSLGLSLSDKTGLIASFYKNIVAILQSMGYKVVSEGVETEEEMSLLSGWGVDMIQGYYFSKPLSEHKIVELLKNQTQRISR